MDKVLLSLLSTPWGRNIIMWFLSVLILGISALGRHSINQTKELKDCNKDRIEDQKSYNSSLEEAYKMQSQRYENLLVRFDALQIRKK